ncbi:hypothetical protein PAPHI01_1811 [Pancytospora philotis]|nr:hypothetical protein PAPHI01_1811 [Pancytospora philotis]
MSISVIQRAVEKFAPREFAAAWDNTGVIIGSDDEAAPGAVLLTIDLTEGVLDECIRKGIRCVVAYHPFIFGGIKTITDRRYLKCIRHGIAVYCPHTQMDHLMNAFLLEKLGGDPDVERAAAVLKRLSGASVLRIARGSTAPTSMVVGVGSAFKNVTMRNTLIITGEMSHHDMLQCKRNDNTVILMEHSNSERIFLPELKRLMEVDPELRAYSIHISESDCDPVEFI